MRRGNYTQVGAPYVSPGGGGVRRWDCTPTPGQWIKGPQQINKVLSVEVVSINGSSVSTDVSNPGKLPWFLITYTVDRALPPRSIATQLNKYWYRVTYYSLTSATRHDRMTTGDRDFLANEVRERILGWEQPNE